MKKLVSIGVALALLTMAVVPGVAAAYTPPDTYSKVPFAMVQSGIELAGTLLDILQTADMGLPEWLDSDLTDPIASWAGGPLSWTVDMLSWGVWLMGDVVAALDPIISELAELPFALGDLTALFDSIACGLMVCWSATNCTGTFDPCP